MISEKNDKLKCLNSFGFDKDYTFENIFEFHKNLFKSILKNDDNICFFDPIDSFNENHVKDLFEELKVLDLKIPNNIEVAKNILNQILLELE